MFVFDFLSMRHALSVGPRVNLEFEYFLMRCVGSRVCLKFRNYVKRVWAHVFEFEFHFLRDALCWLTCMF